ncbi:fungal-specific transcription factor domain-containing protein [Colletotrichum godetiae]|uniref:Fungal-specific transcription factor domain-containing protein n=1 Tax=Colletotrichum godetiae TaxID=1209918 RepID=A0AAJ0ALD0_9PEZI|nr:fungal-specific transcription factor domain-containing protein [Colletotrichum godetiae]KAK1676039.1 fungal-specific transcription factor domain-containing protein [Colletotrichum godetiae]
MSAKSNDKPFHCPACSSRFTRQENLNRHTSSVHQRSNLRPFPCPQCEVSFSRSDLRKRHLRNYHANTDRASETIHVASHATPADGSQREASNAHEANRLNVASNGDGSTPISQVFASQGISWLFKLPQFVSAYFDRFQTTFPLLHQPTFDVDTAQEPLIQAIVCLGAIYQAQGSSQEISSTLFSSGLKSLDIYVRESRRVRFRELWVMQAYLLFEYYAFYSCDDGRFATALKIHRKLVDAVRQYQMLQDRVALGVDEVSSPNEPTVSSSSTVTEHAWRVAMYNESRKRIVYCLYYFDAQLSVCCNIRPLLAALELKYELPCQDDIWQASTAETWQALILSQEGSFNEEDDYDANGDPRPAHGDLYASLMFLMNPNPPDRPMRLLWHSSFACLMLITQILMMIRDLTLASSFLYNNVRCGESKNNLSIISEASRTSIMQALNALSDIMRKPSLPGLCPVTNPPDESDSVESSLWSNVWIVWHYAAMNLTHQESLLTSGIVEYSLPSAVSTCWELGKPRVKQHRDVYEDRDVTRVASSLESILMLLSRDNRPIGLNFQLNSGRSAMIIEDPFITMIGYKACLLGWRIVRLMAVSLQTSSASFGIQASSIYAMSARVILTGILAAIRPDIIYGDQRGLWEQAATVDDAESRYLAWMEATFSARDIWPPSKWIVAVFHESRQETR